MKQTWAGFDLHEALGLTFSGIWEIHMDMSIIPPPESIQLIGDTVAILWPDGQEDYLPMESLRAHSPSAENVGEPDIFGNIHGGDSRTEFPGVVVNDYEFVGRYAIRFIFSDGHDTGLYTFQYLKGLNSNGN